MDASAGDSGGDKGGEAESGELGKSGNSGEFGEFGVIPLRRNRDFQLLWGGQAVSLLGSQTSKIAYPLLVLAMTGSPANAGIAGFAAMLGYLLFPLPAGGVADRYDRKRIMIACDVIRLAAVGSIAVAGWVADITYLQVLVAGFLEGSASVFFSLAQRAALPMLVHPSQRSVAISQNEARQNAAQLAGPTLQVLTLGLIVLARHDGAAPAEIGVIVACMGAGGLAGAFVAPWFQRKIPAGLTITGCMWIWTVLLALIVLIRTPLWLCPVVAMFGFVGPSWNVSVQTYRIRITPNHLLGRTSSVAVQIAWGVTPLGSLLAGFLLQALSPAAAMTVVAAGMAVTAMTATALAPIRHAGRGDRRPQPISAANAARSSR